MSRHTAGVFNISSAIRDNAGDGSRHITLHESDLYQGAVPGQTLANSASLTSLRSTLSSQSTARLENTPGLSSAKEALGSQTDGYKKAVLPLVSELSDRLDLAKFDGFTARTNTRIFSLALITIFLMAATNEMNWDGTNMIESNQAHLIMSLITSGSCVLLITYLIRYYHALWALNVHHNPDSAPRSMWGSKKLMTGLFVESLVCGIHPVYGSHLDITVPGSTVRLDWLLSVLMLMRLYLVGRVIRDRSAVYLKRRTMMRSNGADTVAVVNFNWWLSVKTAFYKSPVKSVAISTALAGVCTAYAVYLAERTSQPDVFKYGNSTWFAAVTMTTVGYGDMTPVTTPGRFVAVFTGVVGIVLSALVVATTIGKLGLTPPQVYAVEWLALDRLVKAEKVLAVRTVQTLWRYHYQRRHLKADTPSGANSEGKKAKKAANKAGEMGQSGTVSIPLASWKHWYTGKLHNGPGDVKWAETPSLFGRRLRSLAKEFRELRYHRTVVNASTDQEPMSVLMKSMEKVQTNQEQVLARLRPQSQRKSTVSAPDSLVDEPSSSSDVESRLTRLEHKLDRLTALLLERPPTGRRA